MRTEFDIANLKTVQLPAFCQVTGITSESEGARLMLLERFIDELEDDWNRENRDKLRKTDCPKIFTADDVLRFSGVEAELDENAPQALKDRVAFASFLDAGGATV